jgi:hypothetical protein
LDARHYVSTFPTYEKEAVEKKTPVFQYEIGFVGVLKANVVT